MLPAQVINTLIFYAVSLISITGYTVIEGDFATYIIGITIIIAIKYDRYSVIQ